MCSDCGNIGISPFGANLFVIRYDKLLKAVGIAYNSERYKTNVSRFDRNLFRENRKSRRALGKCDQI